MDFKEMLAVKADWCRSVGVTPPVCGTCVHFTADHDNITGLGSCAIGGPDPSQGCSDVAPSETCPKWKAKDSPAA